MAGLLPWLLTGWRVATPLPFWAPFRVAGAVLALVAAIFLISAFVRFVTEGLGTPAPVAPTQHLVIGGMYRYVRNPMYLAVVTAVVGQALVLGQLGLLVYAAVAGVAMWAFATFFEEPYLAERFGEEYEKYRRNVPGWLPRRRPWKGDR